MENELYYDVGLQSYGLLYISVSQPPGPGINYTGPRLVLLEFVILVF